MILSLILGDNFFLTLVFSLFKILWGILYFKISFEALIISFIEYIFINN